jgi:transcription initiation factor IIE alpha subunit
MQVSSAVDSPFIFTQEEIEMHTTTIIQCLKKHGQLLDSEIAAETGIPLAKVRGSLSGLSERGEISSCSVTRYNKGKAIEGFLCRIAGYVPPPAPGRKAAPKKD